LVLPARRQDAPAAPSRADARVERLRPNRTRRALPRRRHSVRPRGREDSRARRDVAEPAHRRGALDAALRGPLRADRRSEAARVDETKLELGYAAHQRAAEIRSRVALAFD